MFGFINQFFAALTSLFSAAEKGAKALDHVTTIAEEKAAAFRDEERIKIKARLKKLQDQADKGELAIAE